MSRLCAWNRQVLAWVALSQHSSAIRGPEQGDLGSWKCWKGRVGGDGEWGSSCWAFLPCPRGVMRGDVWLGKPHCSFQLPGPRLSPIGHVLLALAKGQRGKSREQLLAPCHPAIFQGLRKSSAGGVVAVI